MKKVEFLPQKAIDGVLVGGTSWMKSPTFIFDKWPKHVKCLPLGPLVIACHPEHRAPCSDSVSTFAVLVIR